MLDKAKALAKISELEGVISNMQASAGDMMSAGVIISELRELIKAA